MMKREELNTLIDRVTAGKGILRTPSFWMRRVLHAIADSIGEIDSILDEINGEEV